MSEQLELQLLGVAGLVIHFLKLWAKANNDGKNFDPKKAIPNTLLSLITTGVLIYIRADIESTFVVTPISAIMLGYFGNSIFFSLVEARKPKGTPDGEVEGELKTHEGNDRPPVIPPNPKDPNPPTP